MNQVSPFKNRPQRSIVADAASGLGAARPPHVSRRGNRFTLVDGAGNTKPVALIDQQGNVYIDVVIVDANPSPSRMFFDGPYREDNPDPPACWSDNGTGPSNMAAKPQALTCAICPNSAWGSKISALDGKAIPACQSSKKLAVVAIGDESDLVYEFVVPPGSWNGEYGWKKYLATLKQHNVEAYDVVTRISFVGGTMGVLQFMPRPGEAMTGNDPNLVAQIEAAWESGECPKVCGMLDVARDPGLPLIAKPVATNGAPQQQMPPPRPPVQQGPFAAQQALADQYVANHPQTAKRRGRPPKDPTVVPQPNPPVSGNGGQQLDIPPFLQRPQAALSGPQPPWAAEVAPAPATNVVTGQPSRDVNFGLQNPSTPPQDVQDALAAAFNLKTG